MKTTEQMLENAQDAAIEWGRENIKLRSALSALLEQVESLDSFELTRDMEPHKAEACWEIVLQQARDALRVTP